MGTMHELVARPLGSVPMRVIWFALWLATPTAISGQAVDSGVDPPFESVTGAFFALSVADVASSSRWYSEKLGLEVVMEVPKADGQPGVIVLEGGGLIVELIAHDQAAPLSSIAPGTDAMFVHGIFKVGMIVDDFEGTLDRLRDRGVEIALGPFPAQADQRANVLIRDNAGNLIQIFGEYEAGPSRRR
jgi:catechol 2,3-dioxygenase-like lactoylglutathione lyase family enzyme